MKLITLLAAALVATSLPGDTTIISSSISPASTLTVSGAWFVSIDMGDGKLKQALTWDGTGKPVFKPEDASAIIETILRAVKQANEYSLREQLRGTPIENVDLISVLKQEVEINDRILRVYKSAVSTGLSTSQNVLDNISMVEDMQKILQLMLDRLNHTEEFYHQQFPDAKS